MNRTDLTGLSPAEVRARIREGLFQGPTAGLCPGYAQANLVVLPEDLAGDFLLFTKRNPRSCPVLEVSAAGSRTLPAIAPGCDIARDIPRYRVYRDGVLADECTDVSSYWRDDLVSFLIGCSFSFEAALLEEGIPVRHIEEGRNVPMYRTKIACEPAGPFSGNMVVSMRPMTPEQAERAAEITAAMPRVHGAPIQIGDPSAIGIRDLYKPEFGEMVTIRPGEIPVFWPCGVTPQSVVMDSKPPFVITHSPGHMLITDVLNASLKG